MKKALLAGFLAFSMVLETALPTLALSQDSTAPVTSEETADEDLQGTAGPVVLNAANFPDAALRSAVCAELDVSEGTTLTQEQLDGITGISVKAADSLKGIEYFSKLSYLVCDDCSFQSLDISNNTQLNFLRISQNTALTSLDVSRNLLLRMIDLENCDSVKKLDAGGHTNLTDLYFNSERNLALESLDTGGDTSLKTLSVSASTVGLSSLDVTSNTALDSLYCNGCDKMTSIDVSKNSNLTMLTLQNDGLTSLDLSKLGKLETTDYSGNRLTCVTPPPVRLNQCTGDRQGIAVSMKSDGNGYRTCSSLSFVEGTVFDPITVTYSSSNHLFKAPDYLREADFSYTDDTKNLSVSGTVGFSTNSSNLQDACITLTYQNDEYTGSVIVPAVKVNCPAVGGKVLTEGTDYSLNMPEMINAGTYTITAEGLGIFAGSSISAEFTIKKGTIESTDISPVNDQTYTGSAIEPALTIVHNGRTLLAGQDYTAEYSNNINKGTAGITVTPTGNYEGSSISVPFNIVTVSLNDAEITQPSDVTYSGQAFTPDVTVTYKGTVLVKDTDYTLEYSNNTDAGNAIVTAVGKGDYGGKISTGFTINKASAGTISVSCADTVYGSKPQPEATASQADNIQILYKARGASDDSYSEEAPVNAGDYTVQALIAETQNYLPASATADFTIEKAEGGLEFSCADISYGETPAPDITKNLSGGNVTYLYKKQGDPDNGYSSSVPTEIGSYTVKGTAAATVNYTAASATADFAIGQADVGNAAVSGINTAYMKTGSAIKPVPQITSGGRKLAGGTDYELSYGDNTEEGTGTVTISGIGNFSGQKVITFKIIKGLTAGLYTITVKPDGKTVKALDVNNGTAEDGGNIRIFETNGTAAQLYQLILLDDGYYRIVNVRSGKSLDVAGGSPANGANVQQYTWNGTDAQKWKLTSEDALKWTVSSKVSGKVLDVDNASAANGTNVQIYTSNGSDAQNWYFTAVSVPVSDAHISLEKTVFAKTGSPVEPQVTVTYGGLTLEKGVDYEVSYENNKEAGTASAVITGTGSYSGTQTLHFSIAATASEIADGQTYVLLSKKDMNLAVDVNGGGIVNGSRIQLHRNNGTEAQKFILKANADGTYQILNEKCGLSLDVPGNSHDNGVLLQLYNPNGTSAQKWKLVKDDASGSYSLINSDSGKAVDVPGGNAVQGASLQMYKENHTEAQEFYLVETQAEAREYEGTYTLASSKDGKMVMDVAMGSVANGANVQLYQMNGTKAQRFTFLYSGDGYYRIINVNSGKALDVQGGNPGDWVNIWQYNYNGTDAQLWKVRKNTDGTITLINKKGKALDVAGGAMGNGTNIQTYTDNGTAAQKWTLKKIS